MQNSPTSRSLQAALAALIDSRTESLTEHRLLYVLMPKAMRDVLLALPAPHEGKVFPWTVDTITHKVKEALCAAGMGDLHLHHLRHSFGAAFIEAGGDVRTLMDLLGHRQISTTLIYTRLSPEHLAKEIDRVAVPGVKKPRNARKSNFGLYVNRQE